MNARIERTDESDADAPERGERHWVDTYAYHVRRRFNSRARVSVRIAGDSPVELSYIYALEEGGLVLCLLSDEAGHEQGHHGHLGGELGTGVSELWIKSPNDAVFEAHRVEDGVLCTGFGYLGLSRTPHILVPRGTEPPPKPDHHKHDDF